MKKWHKLIIILIMFSFSHSFGYAYLLSVMKKKMPNGQEQCIIGIGDYHDKTHPANKIQRDYLEKYLSQLKKSKLIVEDLSSVNNDGRSMCCRYVINSRGGFLGKLADVARAHNNDVDNVEYRYCRVAGIGPMLHNKDKNPLTIPAASIEMKFLAKEVMDELDVIKNYKDDALLNALYVKTVQDVLQTFKRLRLDEQGDQTIADYCKQKDQKKHVKNLEQLCIFDSSLIDMKIVHSIVSDPDKLTILVAGGGSHIEKVVKILSSLGYGTIFSSADGKTQYPVIESALGSTEKMRTSAAQPPALDLKVLDQFMR